MKRLLQAIFLLGVSAVLAGVAFWLRPVEVDFDADAYDLSLQAALALPEALWVDARTDEEFAQGTYDGAIQVTEDHWDDGFVGLLERWQPGQVIVVFCSTHSCMRSRQVAKRLREELAYEEIYSLADGWEALEGLGHE